MQFDSRLTSGTLLRRYKRFLADVQLEDGSVLTAHTANTGSMRGCAEPGSRVWLRDSGNDQRKYRYSWEMVEAVPGILVGINTGLSNRLVEEAIAGDVVAPLRGYANLRREVRYGRQNSRIDLLLQNHDGGLPDCYVEVKNVTLVENGIARFPDAVSARGSKHLQELMAMVAAGHRAVIFYCVQREDVCEVQPADDIDPVYGQCLRQAVAAGVEAMAYRAEVSTAGISLRTALPVVCPPLSG